MNKVKRILEICPYSKGICGVFTRVRQESIELEKIGYEVVIFSSNLIKGTKNATESEEKINNIRIYRFNNKSFFISENVVAFDFKKKFNEIKPDLVITHLLHPHSLMALRLCKKKKIPCFLVTHAPFKVKRKFPLNIATRFYNKFFIEKNTKKFTKVIHITKWEIPWLLEMGISKDKLEYIPNGVPEEFYKNKIRPFKGKKIVFFGRISPVKDIETLLEAFNEINDKRIELEIIGPIERGYENILKYKGPKIKFTQPIYDQNRKIKAINEADIFVLPSKREAMPQALIEAMALGKIVIASRTDGSKEIIEDGKNGFLFNIGDKTDLSNKIVNVINLNKDKVVAIQKNARKTAERFNWAKLIKKLISII